MTTIPQTLVERVALAIYLAIGDTAMDCEGLALQDGRIFFGGDFEAGAVARAAIAAMREPDGAMLEAALVDGGPVTLHPRKTWHRMIDAALSEGVDGCG